VTRISVNWQMGLLITVTGAILLTILVNWG
jgi:hypothetical protein